jgi:hypothetical protein
VVVAKHCILCVCFQYVCWFQRIYPIEFVRQFYGCSNAFGYPIPTKNVCCSRQDAVLKFQRLMFSQSCRDFSLTDCVCVLNRQLGSLRPLLGMRPWTASDFALGATLIAPLELVKSFGVLSLAALTSGLPIPDRTFSLSDSVLKIVVFMSTTS